MSDNNTTRAFERVEPRPGFHGVQFTGDIEPTFALQVRDTLDHYGLNDPHLPLADLLANVCTAARGYKPCGWLVRWTTTGGHIARAYYDLEPDLAKFKGNPVKVQLFEPA